MLLPIIYIYILSRLDYCNRLPMGTLKSVIQPLQKIQNFAATLVLLAPCHHHSTPLLEKLHWFPISERMKYKVACVHFNALNSSGPAYLSNTPSCTLHSSSDTCMLKIRQYQCRTHSFQNFCYFGPHIWIHSHKTLDTAQAYCLLKPNCKLYLLTVLPPN